MEKIKIHVLRTGEVRVSPYLPFGGDDCSIIKASGITTLKSKWIWLPVFSFLIEHPKGLVLFDTGWHREMSPDGVYDKKMQRQSLQWIREQSMSPDCIESLATHDTEVQPHVIEI